MSTMLPTNLKVLRTYYGRSQEETAIALEVKRSSYSGYETGAAEPSLSLLVRMSEHFRVTTDLLLRFDLGSLRGHALQGMMLELQRTNAEAAVITTDL